MQLIENDAVILKGFYTSTKNPIIQKHGNIYGCFILSLDYVLSNGINKKIITVRLFIERKRIESLMDQLFDNYGNYHLNYLIFMSPMFFDEKYIAKYNSEINKFIHRYNDHIPEHVPFNKNNIYEEFYTIKRIFKSKEFVKEEKKMLFVNENIYTIYMHTGMNKPL
jgi:hypothetical protein